MSLKEEFQSHEYRRAYAESFANTVIATQIRLLRGQLTQRDFAELIGVKQSRVSAMEDENYSSWSTKTLKRIAAARDVVFVGRFVSFGEMLDISRRLSPETLTAQSFSSDPAFSTTVTETEIEVTCEREDVPYVQTGRYFNDFEARLIGGQTIMRWTGKRATSMSPETPVEPAAVTFSFDRLVVHRATFEEVARLPVEPGETRPPKLTATLNVSLKIEQDSDHPRGKVTFGVEVEPDRKWQPYQVHVVIGAFFSMRGGNPAVFDQFCKMGVPPILFPYARQIIHSLTTDAAFGVLRLDPINLQSLTAQKPAETDHADHANGTTEPSRPSSQ